MSERRFRALVVAAGVLALAIRVGWVLWVSREPVGLYDPARYLGYARQIADGNGMVEPFSGHPTAYYPPGYPWFLGIVTWLSGPFTDDVPLVAGLVQAVLGAATAVLGGLVARRLAGALAGVVAACGLAVYPNLVFHSGALLGETLYDALFMGFLAVVLARPWRAGPRRRGADGPECVPPSARSSDRPTDLELEPPSASDGGATTGSDARLTPTLLTTRRVVATGLLLGLAIMVRPISLAVIPVVVGCWWWARRDAATVLRWTAVLLLSVAACVVPWTVRNAIRMDELIPISTNTGDNLCIGHAPGANGSFNLRPACDTDFNLLDGPADEVGADREKTSTALQAIADDPGREPWLLWRRFWFTWVRDGDHDGLLAVQSYRADRFIDPDVERSLARTADIAYWIVGAAGLAGAAALVARRRPEDLLVVGSAVMTALVPLAFFGDSRFKVPVVPLLIVMAATLTAPPWRDGSARPTG